MSDTGQHSIERPSAFRCCEPHTRVSLCRAVVSLAGVMTGSVIAAALPDVHLTVALTTTLLAIVVRLRRRLAAGACDVV